MHANLLKLCIAVGVKLAQRTQYSNESSIKSFYLALRTTRKEEKNRGRRKEEEEKKESDRVD